MTTLDDAKLKTDTNKDGKLSLDELEKVRNGKNSNAVDALEAKARRYNGKVNIKGVEDTLVKI